MAAPLAIIGIGATVLGGITSAIGAEQKGAADAGMYNYQSQVALLNQRIALQNAAYAQEAGGTAAYQSGLKTAALVGHQKVAQSASGFDVGGGSAVGVRTSTEALGVVDQNLIRTNFAKRAYGYEVEAATKGAEAGADVIAGQQARKAADISAISSILGAAGSVAGKWTQASTSFGSPSQGITTYDSNMNPSGWQA